MVEGVNFFGALETSDGIGRAAKLNMLCLEKAGLTVDKYVVSRPVALQSGKDTIINDELISRMRFKISIFHFSARWVPHYFAHLSGVSLKDFYNIGYWVCETPSIPSYWAWQSEYFDEIWTASKFCQDAISKSVNIPVLTIPHAVEHAEVSDRILSRSKVGNASGFNFLTIFNTYSDAERKNALFCIRAFLGAYSEMPSVHLVVKVSNLEHDSVLGEKLHAIARRHCNVRIISGYLEDMAIAELYEDADVYVSLHRAEGFGLTITDAISRGIPVICTGYSGNMEFCDASDIRLVSHELKQIDHERLRYRQGDIWAEPDMDDAVKAFKEVVVDPARMINRAAKARRRVLEGFSLSAIGNMSAARLNLIGSGFRYHDDLSNRLLHHEVGVKETYGF